MKAIKLFSLILLLLIFLTGCKTVHPELVENNIYSVGLESSKLYTYEIQARVRENMPEYRFIASGEDIFVTGLNVYDENDISILSASFELEDCPVYPQMMDTMGLHIVDVNFDGYKDIIILDCFIGAHSNSWYNCWLWDVKTSAFIFCKSFTNICNPALDQSKECIYSTRGSGVGYHSWYIYMFIDEDFTVSNSLDFEWIYNSQTGNLLGVQIIERRLLKWKNGRSK